MNSLRLMPEAAAFSAAEEWRLEDILTMILPLYGFSGLMLSARQPSR